MSWGILCEDSDSRASFSETREKMERIVPAGFCPTMLN